MGSTAAATSESLSITKAPIRNVERTCLYEGVVSIQIPLKARFIRVEHVKGGLSYRLFTRPVKGGVINFHAHGALSEKNGQKLVAWACVFEKEVDDGRTYLYVDLLPAARETPTHRMNVVQHTKELPAESKHCHVFPSKTLGGGIVMQTL